MPRVTQIEGTVNLPNIGEVVFLADYGAGHYGSYHTPPEPPEVNVLHIKDGSGCQVILSDEQYEEYYDLFLEAADEKYQDLMASYYEQYAFSISEDEALVAMMSADTL